MDFGISRFLEMFEERFGRRATTALLALIGIAIAAWGLQTIIGMVVYVYKLTLKANLVPEFEAESILAHLIFFGAQIAITAVVLGYLWRKIAELRMRSFKKWTQQEMQKMVERYDQIQKQHAEFMRAFELTRDAGDKAIIAMKAIQTAVQEKVEFIKAKEAQEAKSPPEPPHQVPGPVEPPKTN